MQIIAISGHANEGKTKTVKKLGDILFSEAQNHKHTVVRQQYKDTGLEYVKLIDLELTVALGKDGDTLEQVQNNCTAAVEIGADIFIQTTRTKGGGVDYLFNFAQDTHDIIQIGTVRKYFSLKSQFFANETAIERINEIQTKNVWILLLYILQQKYDF